MDAKIVADARNFLRGFRSAVAFAEAIEEVASLEAVTASLKQSYETLSIDINKQRAILLELGEKQREAEATLEDAKSEARKILKDAKQKADIAATAKLKAAEADSTAMVEKAKSAIKGTQKELEELRQEVGRLATQRSNALAELQNAQKQYSDFKAKFA